jgi:dihydroflavonol-4-reductase
MIVVTGGTGFLGAYIIKELVDRGYKVRAIRRKNNFPTFIPASIFEKVEWFDGDILDVVSLQDAFEGASAVIHAAAMVSFHRGDKEAMFQTNVEGTANVVNMALEAGIQKLVHVSSIAAIGRTVNGDTVNEEKKWAESKTNTNYAVSKYQAELEVWRGIAEGLNAVIVNPSTILGYGDWNNSSCALFKSIYNEFPYYSNGINGFVGVEDAARAIVLLMESGISSKRFILNSENWSFRKLFDTIADAFGKKRPSREATPLLSAIAWRYEKLKGVFGKKPMLTKESAKIANSVTYYNNSGILNALPGFSFTPLEQTIKMACAQYQRNLN